MLSLKPTVVLVNFGLNGHNYEAFREDVFRAYVCSQTEIVKVLSRAGARTVLLTPQPIEERRADPDKDARNQSFRKFSAGLKSVAAGHGARQHVRRPSASYGASRCNGDSERKPALRRALALAG